MPRTKRTQRRGLRGKLNGGVRRPERAILKMIIQRCCNPANSDFKSYGARGIRVADRWLASDGFANFLADVGPQPFAGAGLRRLDESGHFEPGNVVWDVTRSKKILTLGDRTMTLAAWARELNIAPATIRARLRKGWSIEATLTRTVAPRMPRGMWATLRRMATEIPNE